MFLHLLLNWIVSENARWKQYKKINTQEICPFTSVYIISIFGCIINTNKGNNNIKNKKEKTC